MRKDKFQPRYQIHEYPGRKPWYVVRKYIERYARPGETVLEPFCGSGVIPCEALIAGRKAIAVDIDPLAILISEMTCISPVDLAKLEQAFTEVKRVAKETIYVLYLLEEKCSVCDGQLVISSAARMPQIQEVNVRAFCSECDETHELVYELQGWEKSIEEPIPYWHPEGVELPEGIRGNIRYLHELYTNRNLKALSILWNFINSVEDEIYRDLLRLCFSATLSKASSINIPKTSGKGWTPADYSAYNIPDNFIEFNVWDGFSNKFRSCLEAKEQTNQLIGDMYASARIVNASAENLTFIPDNSVDYVFTDPPYADVVRYYAEFCQERVAWFWDESIAGGISCDDAKGIAGGKSSIETRETSVSSAQRNFTGIPGRVCGTGRKCWPDTRKH
ncbi:DNA methyltransferase [Candidatus Poribacteria bacterium]